MCEERMLHQASAMEATDIASRLLCSAKLGFHVSLSRTNRKKSTKIPPELPAGVKGQIIDASL